MPKARTLAFIVVVLVAFVGAGCGRAIQVVVPDGFSGEARVVFDPAAGQALESKGFCYVLRIPPTGELRIRDQAPLYRWHYESVRYANGKTARVANAFVIGGSKGLTGSTEFPGTTHVWVIEPKAAR